MKDRNQRFPTVYDLGRALLPFAMPDSRIHVERAERVLGATDIVLSSVPMMGPMTDRRSLPQGSTPVPSMPITPFASSPPVVLRHVEPTINSWGQNGANAPSKRRGPLLIAIGVVAALLAGGIGLWAARSGSEAKVPPVAPLANAETAKPTPAAPPPVEELTTPVPATPAPAPPSAEPATIAVTPPAPPLVVQPKHKGPPVVAAKAAIGKKAETKKVETSPVPTKAGGITDFGGRR
jgi:hypothetical protein